MEENTQLYFPANLGDSPDQRGQKTSGESYAVTLTSDLSGKAPVEQPIIENVDLLFDQFGNNNTKNRKLLYADVNRYGLDPQEWDAEETLTGTLAERVNALHPGIANNIENFDIRYTTTSENPVARIFFENSGIQLLLPANPSSVIGTRQALLASKRRFRIPAGSPVMFTMGVRAVGSGDNFIKQWGAFSSNTGFFLEAIGDGSGDKLRIVRRFVQAGTVRNQLIARSQWADPLDGTGASEAFVTLTNVTMWGIQISASDGGIADFYCYCEDAANGGIFRWIKFATVGAADSNTLRAIQEEGLPVTFSNIGLSAPSENQLLAKYGVSVTLSGDEEGGTPGGNGSISTSGILRRDIPATAIAMLETKALVNNKIMSSVILPTQIALYCQFPVQLSLILNPSNNPVRSPVTSTYYSNYLVELHNINEQVIGGQEVACFPVFGSCIYDLRSIFSRVRAIMAAQFNNPFQVEGASDYLAVLAQSRLYFAIRPLVVGYNEVALVPGLATNTEEMTIQYDSGSPPTIISNIEVLLSIFFEDF